ncbi:hypothetical protein LINPERPRIM_LOCUS7861 [Linum perenne]
MNGVIPLPPLTKIYSYLMNSDEAGLYGPSTETSSSTRQDTSGNQSNPLLGLKRSQEPINHEEVDDWKDGASREESNMEDIKDNKQNVEVCVEEELEELCAY